MTLKPIEYCIVGLVNAITHLIALLAYVVFSFVEQPHFWIIIPLIYIFQGIYLVIKNINKIDDSRLS